MREIHQMAVSPGAGKLAEPSQLVDLAQLITAYYSRRPDPAELAQRVSFGTSGHRGSSFRHSFNERHILAITQAIVFYRQTQGTDGPLFLGKDTHALSEPAFVTALEVLAANEVEVRIDTHLGYTPTPAISLAILLHNRGRTSGLADGIVITPSHNPPDDGGFKYNAINGGPADTQATKWIENKANELLENDLREVKRMLFEIAVKNPSVHRHDYIAQYVGELDAVIDFEAIRGAELHLAADPLGGAGVAYWPRIAEHYRLDLTVLNANVDGTFRFMTVDWDGKIRMDCSSPYAMASLIQSRERFDVAFASDPDHDRHGIVTRSAGLLNPNHYLATAISYLFAHRKSWSTSAGVGKTAVSSGMIDRVAGRLGRNLVEVPVGFKYFVDGLLDGSLGFGGEESAGASFLRKEGTVWSTDKDGLIMGLLSAEMMAVTGRDPGELYRRLTEEFGNPVYQRIDAPATREQKAILAKLSPEQVHATDLAGEVIKEMATTALGNGAPLGGLKVSTKNAWFAARPSGTEDVYKIYAESFLGEEHLKRVQTEARDLIARVVS